VFKTTSMRWWGVCALLMVVGISYVDRINVSVLITNREFTDHFGITGDRAAQGALMTLFLVGYGVSALLITPYYEAALGVRRGLLVSLLSWSVFTILSPYAAGAVMLLAMRLLLGAGEGPLFSLKTMYVKDQFAEHELGKPNAVTSMGISLGTAAGLPLVTFAVYHLGWHGSFLSLAALNILVGIPLVLLFVQQAPRGRVTRRSAPASLVSALRTPRLGWILLIEIATLGYLWGSSSWLPSYLLQARHFSLAQMGLLSALPFLLSLGSQFLGGYVIDKLAPARVPLVLVAGSIATAACVTTVVVADSRWVAVAALILANGCWGLQGPAIPTLVQQYAAPGTVGSSYGVINGVGNLVAAALPALMGFAITAGGAQGFNAGYTLLAATQGMTLLGALVLLARHRTRPRAVPVPPVEPSPTDAASSIARR
jgi:predicted MFS family arabinose efflux permease